MRNFTSPKLGTHVDHDEEYVPVKLQLSSINFTALKKLKPLPLPTQLLGDKAINWLETSHTSRASLLVHVVKFSFGRRLVLFPTKSKYFFRETDATSNARTSLLLFAQFGPAW
jgi:hypothetical protein